MEHVKGPKRMKNNNSQEDCYTSRPPLLLRRAQPGPFGTSGGHGRGGVDMLLSVVAIVDEFF
jgi:hypothetical protein